MQEGRRARQPASPAHCAFDRKGQLTPSITATLTATLEPCNGLEFMQACMQTPPAGIRRRHVIITCHDMMSWRFQKQMWALRPVRDASGCTGGGAAICLTQVLLAGARPRAGGWPYYCCSAAASLASGARCVWHFRCTAARQQRLMRLCPWLLPVVLAIAFYACLVLPRLPLHK